MGLTERLAGLLQLGQIKTHMQGLVDDLIEAVENVQEEVLFAFKSNLPK